MHVNRYNEIDPDFVRYMLRHLYVDDLYGSVPTVEEGMELYRKVKTRFREGNFNVRKWRSRDPELSKFLTKQENLGEKKDGESKMLGIIWNEADEFVMDDIWCKYD